MKNFAIGLLMLALFDLVGCTSLPMSVSEPEIQLRRDIFQEHPVWESRLFKQEQIPSSKKKIESFPESTTSATISPDTAPGLYDLLKQVDPNNTMLTDNDSAANLTVRKMARAANTEKPLPANIAATPLVKGFVISLAAAHYNSRLQKIIAYRAEVLADHRETNVGSAQQALYQITDDEKYTAQSFLDLGRVFLKTNSMAFQSPSNDLLATLKENHDALKVATAAKQPVGAAQPTTQPAIIDPKTITYSGLTLQYFSAYYGGNFVDRDGGTLSKPTFGATVSDTTLSNAATVGLEAIYDWAIIKSSKLTPDKVIKSPIIYDTNKKKWLTAKGGMPTLANVFHVDTSNFKAVPYVIEELKTDTTEPGMTSSKIQLVKLLGGGGGDAAAGLNGAIMRAFGGVHIGFSFGLGLLGKISVGDNNALANLVEAACGSIATRSTELFTSNMVYNVTYKSGQDEPQPSPLVLVLEYLDSVQTQDPGASGSNGGNTPSH